MNKRQLRKSVLLGMGLLTISCSIAIAQEVKEVIQPLSKKAYKGFLYDFGKDDGGGTKVTYVMRGDKKDAQDLYEAYSFDKDLKFSGSKDIEVKRESRPDIERAYYYASVGGANSFNVLSMNLKLSKIVRHKVWDFKKQRYVTSKVISNETIKARNDNGTVYNGYAAYSSDDDDKTGVFVLAKIDTKKKGEDDKYYVLLFDDKMEINPTALDLKGAYTLVFCDQLSSENVVMIFAPEDGNGSPDNYVYFQYDIQGKQIQRIEFKSPANAMLITAAIEKNGSVYLCGSSTKSTDAYSDVFSEYAPIFNPGYTQGGNNKLDFNWQKASNEKMENFHLLKFTGNQMAFSSTTPIAEFKSKFRTSPEDKGADVYKGKKIYVEQFYVTADDDYLIAGQLKDNVNLGMGNPVTSYNDIVCFHFDKAGKLKSQFGVEKMNTDKKSEIFEMDQNFYPSADGKSLYWVILEVKGVKGYASMMDAYNGAATFYPVYFPRVAKLDLSAGSVSSFKVLGNEDFFLRKDYLGYFDKGDNSMTYIGHDEDFKKLWLGKVSFK